jgi:hypothetical protein
MPASLPSCCSARLSALVADQRNNHAVQVEEEHEQVEAELDEALLLVHVQFSEDLSRVEEVLVVEDPAVSQVSMSSPLRICLASIASQRWLSQMRA